MKYLLVFVFCMISFQFVTAQRITPALVSTTGRESTVGNVSVQYTIGLYGVFSSGSSQASVSSPFTSSTLYTGIVKNTDDISTVKVSTYPNPTSGVLNISFPGSSTENDYIIYVYDMLGRKVSSYNVSNTTSTGVNLKTTIDLSNFCPGQYFIKIMYDRNQKSIASLKVIKK